LCGAGRTRGGQLRDWQGGDGFTLCGSQGEDPEVGVVGAKHGVCAFVERAFCWTAVDGLAAIAGVAARGVYFLFDIRAVGSAK